MIFWLRNKKNNLLTILLVIAFLVSFCSSAFSSSFKIGFPAPTFTLKTIDGETFNLEDYKEKQKLLILYFCNNESENSVCGIEELAKYFEEYIIEEKYQVIMINTHKDLKEEDITQIKEFWANKKISFTILLDSQEEVSNLYNIEVLPTTILLAKNLVAKRVYPGLISKQQNLMFQYISYFLAAQEKGVPKKDKKEGDGCDDGTCDPPPGY
ncbi:MAG TPA: TlpA disulfide reductase family protein [Atribacterota bacterium]|nr:TlpA disulfide reductase family protein [Atribacterota bacterium]